MFKFAAVRSFAVIRLSNMAFSTERYAKLETLKVTKVAEWVARVDLNRPDKRNAMNKAMFREIGECFDQLAEDESVRCVILSGQGKSFCAGIDVKDSMESFSVWNEENDVSRRAWKIRKHLASYQNQLSALERCRKPVIATLFGHCIGSALDMVSGADVRHCAHETFFSIKEVELGLAPDVGTIQRLLKCTGNGSLLRELILTGRQFDPETAVKLGLVSKVFPDAETLMKGAEELAVEIASKSPVAIQVAKESINYSRDHSVQDGLDHIANWNMGMLQSEDLPKSVMAMMQKAKADFAKL